MRPTLARSISHYLQHQAEGKDSKAREFFNCWPPLAQLFTQELLSAREAVGYFYPSLKGVSLMVPLYQACSLLNIQEGSRIGGILQMKKLRHKDLTQLMASLSCYMIELELRLSSSPVFSERCHAASHGQENSCLDFL